MDPSQELVVLRGEIAANKQTVNALRHQLKTAGIEHRASNSAAASQLQELRHQLDECKRRLMMLERTRGTPEVPRALLQQAQEHLEQKKRDLLARRRECAALEGVIKSFSRDPQLMLLELFDQSIPQDATALAMISDVRRKSTGGGAGVAAAPSFRSDSPGSRSASTLLGGHSREP